MLLACYNRRLEESPVCFVALLLNICRRFVWDWFPCVSFRLCNATDILYTTVILMNICSVLGVGPTINMSITTGKLIVEFHRLEADWCHVFWLFNGLCFHLFSALTRAFCCEAFCLTKSPSGSTRQTNGVQGSQSSWNSWNYKTVLKLQIVLKF